MERNPNNIAYDSYVTSVQQPRRNRVDPWGDLHSVAARGMFTGNRGCVVDDRENVVRHHANTSLWIICATTFRDWKWPLARPRRWTPLFFLDDAVALAAGHRPCSTCRRCDYVSYRDAVTRGLALEQSLLASELNERLRAERLLPGRGIDRRNDRIMWTADCDTLPDGTVIVDSTGDARLVLGELMFRFAFDGWTDPLSRPRGREVRVLTPPTSVVALRNGFVPSLTVPQSQVRPR